MMMTKYFLTAVDVLKLLHVQQQKNVACLPGCFAKTSAYQPTSHGCISKRYVRSKNEKEAHRAQNYRCYTQCNDRQLRIPGDENRRADDGRNTSTGFNNGSEVMVATRVENSLALQSLCENPAAILKKIRRAQYKILSEAEVKIVQLSVHGKVFTGAGRCKKQAKVQAAKAALETLYGDEFTYLSDQVNENQLKPISKKPVRILNIRNGPQYKTLSKGEVNIVQVSIDGKIFTGEGRCKKQAKVQAAKAALETLYGDEFTYLSDQVNENQLKPISKNPVKILNIRNGPQYKTLSKGEVNIVQVSIDGKIFTGEGRCKKQAKVQAAKAALETLYGDEFTYLSDQVNENQLKPISKNPVKILNIRNGPQYKTLSKGEVNNGSEVMVATRVENSLALQSLCENPAAILKKIRRAQYKILSEAEVKIVQLSVHGKVFTGAGRCKKQAKVQAAKAALETLYGDEFTYLSDQVNENQLKPISKKPVRILNIRNGPQYKTLSKGEVNIVTGEGRCIKEAKAQATKAALETLFSDKFTAEGGSMNQAKALAKALPAKAALKTLYSYDFTDPYVRLPVEKKKILCRKFGPDGSPSNLETMDHIIFLDLDNWPYFFNRIPMSLPRKTFVWAFHGGTNKWIEPTTEAFRVIKSENFFFLQKCGITKDAADFALCLSLGRMDERLPKHIPFTIASGDKGFSEIVKQMKTSIDRQIVIVDHYFKIYT